jgi:hemerythrin-like domain-containing protein
MNMMPIGPLMIEHRLIEKMVRLLDRRGRQAATLGVLDTRFLDIAVDFIRTYADRCHHGKEEAILFRDLALKPLAVEHRKTMDELVREHIQARQMTSRLVAARGRYVAGDPGAVKDAAAVMGELVQFYPVHIVKEDRGFFIPVMKYFTEVEQKQMLDEFWEFDRRLVHERYRDVVKQLDAMVEV